jgi:hypothetical protein
MAKVIDEVAEYTEDITVPEGTDSRVDAANVVEALAQGLANRTAYLLGQILGFIPQAAKLMFDNVFTGNNSFTRTVALGMSDPLQPGLEPEASAAAGKWKLVLRMKLNSAGTMHASIWSGSNGTVDRFILATNARYDGTQWVQEQAGLASSAIKFEGTDGQAITVLRMLPGDSGGWDAGELSALSVSASNFYYNKLRFLPVPLGNSSSDYSSIVGADYATVLAVTSSGNKHIALRFPENMLAGSTLQIMHSKASSANTFFEVIAVEANWSTPGPLTVTSIGGVGVTSSGMNVTEIAIPAIAARPEAEYRLRWAPANTADRLYAVRLANMSDRGPLNSL